MMTKLVKQSSNIFIEINSFVKATDEDGGHKFSSSCSTVYSRCYNVHRATKSYSSSR